MFFKVQININSIDKYLKLKHTARIQALNFLEITVMFYDFEVNRRKTTPQTYNARMVTLQSQKANFKCSSRRTRIS